MALATTQMISGGNMFRGKPSPTPLDELRNAIILQAVKDYRKAFMKRMTGPLDKRSEYLGQCCELERFFASEWCRMLTEIDMVKAAQLIREQVKFQVKSKLSRAMKGA